MCIPAAAGLEDWSMKPDSYATPSVKPFTYIVNICLQLSTLAASGDYGNQFPMLEGLMLAPTGRTLNHQNIECSVVRGCFCIYLFFCIFAHDNFVWVSHKF